ncbi:hypothetical protein KC345_g47 [Hortaea werneckii]|nr:hypothetical protein KC345_g47 [Hortaea werneckii]
MHAPLIPRWKVQAPMRSSREYGAPLMGRIAHSSGWTGSMLCEIRHRRLQNDNHQQAVTGFRHNGSICA